MTAIKSEPILHNTAAPVSLTCKHSCLCMDFQNYIRPLHSAVVTNLTYFT